ncbi:MAG: nucleotidyltransferase domain-containing protein [Truepera sp.]|nr:nucleotidyltransferase domain-containing protein [Truepera sp.]MBS3968041.1 nucleotidyltransferase domain-containing protein [Truepera sp.]MBS3968298.1 nucleotidyltransferase domain-containing protein [Truepera sp.]
MATLTLAEAVSEFSAQVAEILKDGYQDKLVSVCLFGSAARGQLRKGSDIDFLVVLKEAYQTYPKRVKELMPLLASIRESEEYERLEGFALNLEPSFLISTVDEVMRHPPLLIEIAQEGKILFDRDDFLKQELNKVRKAMVRLGSVRKETAHGHYWVLKPDLKSDEVIEL